MAKLDHEKHRHNGKPTLSAQADAARRERADAYLSGESVMVAPAKSSRDRGFAGYSEDFDTFWRLYPRKEGKGGAFQTWKRLSASDRHAAYRALKDRLAYLMAKMNDPKGNFCPHCSTWLRDRWFDDEAPAAVPQPSAAPVVRQSAPPTQPDRFPFGKYNSQTIAHAEASEPTYLDWLMLQEWFPQRFPDLARNVQIAISTREEAVTPVPDWSRSKIVAAAISAALTGAAHKKVVKKRKKRGSGADNVVQLRPMVTKIAGRAEKDALREGIAARKVGKPCVSPYTLPDGSPILLLRACHAAWPRGREAGA